MLPAGESICHVLPAASGPFVPPNLEKTSMRMSSIVSLNLLPLRPDESNTRRAAFRFCACRVRMFSSTVSLATRRKTFTSCVCPMRCTLLMAWFSVAGFHHRSHRNTTSPAVMLSPVPPARMLTSSVRPCTSLPSCCSSWNHETHFRRCSTVVLPSSFCDGMRRFLRNPSRMSRNEVKLEKTTERFPSLVVCASRSSSVATLTEMKSLRGPSSGAAPSSPATLANDGWHVHCRNLVSKPRTLDTLSALFRMRSLNSCWALVCMAS
mmetsp:Transcript_27252/g.67990  ORF Transcript_27252/g.67990 Transcript_27252/m.67990 type:complete len:265 (+) Transcript_27252:159-953(+)